MWIVRYGDEILHDPRTDDRVLVDMSGTARITDASEFKFTMPPTHPMLGRIVCKQKDVEITVECDGVVRFCGRALTRDVGWDLSETYSCEGERTYLNDVVLPPYSTAPEVGVVSPREKEAVGVEVSYAALPDGADASSGSVAWGSSVALDDANKNLWSRAVAVYDDGSRVACDPKRLASKTKDKTVASVEELFLTTDRKDVSASDAGWSRKVEPTVPGESVHMLTRVRFTDGEVSDSGPVVVASYEPAPPMLAPSEPGRLFDWYIGRYNEKSMKSHRFTVGVNEADSLDPNAYILRESSQRPNVWSEVKEKLLSKLGGQIRVRHEGGLRYIDYLAEGGKASSQRIEFGENLLDYAHNQDYTGLVTALVPYGRTDDGKEVTISALEDGDLQIGFEKRGDAVVWVEGHDKYGYIEDSLQVEAATPEGVLRSGLKALQKITIGDTLEVPAADLHALDPSVGQIMEGDYVRCTSIPHGFDEYFLVKEVNFDPNAPGGLKYTLGDGYETISSSQSKRMAQLNDSINAGFEEAVAISNEAKAAADSAVTDTYEEYAKASSRVSPPESGWGREPPELSAGESAWRRTVTAFGDGTETRGGAVLLTGESAASVELLATGGTVIRNSRGSTTLTANVLYGGERIADTETLVAFFGDSAHLVWQELSGGSFAEIAFDDPRIGADGWSITVSAAQVNEGATFACNLVI